MTRPHHGVPTVDHGGLYKALGATPNAVSAVAIPGTTPGRNDGTRRAVGLILHFVDGSGNEVAGRVGFAGDDQSASITLLAADEQLGHHKNGHQEPYWLPTWAKFIHLASNTASAVARGIWLYE